MTIVTSYMANYRKYGNHISICIMRWKPKYFNGIHFPLLAPSSENLSAYKYGKMSFDTFHDEMIKQLELLDAKEVFHQLEQFGNDIVLLCTCKDYKHCHRKIVADWLSKELSIKIKELI